MDQYVSWSLSTDELMLDTIWEKIEEFCKLQLNEVRPDLTYFQASGKETSQMVNGTIQYRPRLLWLSTPKETTKKLHRDIFWFFLKDEEFVSKTINDSNTDLDKFATSKVSQLAKKIESSKVTTRHIKQVASDPQVAQINLMRH